MVYTRASKGLLYPDLRLYVWPMVAIEAFGTATVDDTNAASPNIYYTSIVPQVLVSCGI